MKLLTLIMIVLLSVQLSVAEEFDPSIYVVEEKSSSSSDSLSRTESQSSEEFDPNIYVVEEVETQNDTQITTNIVGSSDNGNNNENLGNNELVIETESKVQQTIQQNSTSNLILIGFALAVVSLMLIIILYSIHYYREKHHLK